MLELRRSLPAFKEKDALLKAISENQVMYDSCSLLQIMVECLTYIPLQVRVCLQEEINQTISQTFQGLLYVGILFVCVPNLLQTFIYFFIHGLVLLELEDSLCAVASICCTYISVASRYASVVCALPQSSWYLFFLQPKDASDALLYTQQLIYYFFFF